MCSRLRAAVKASLLVLIVIDLAADNDFGFMRGRGGKSVVSSDTRTMQLSLLL